jgi:hypothetical protein
MLVAGAVIAAQGWSDDQDGDNFTLSNVNSVQVNSLAGVGTSCVQADNNGLLSVTGSACGSGLGGSAGGTVTVVTGSDPIFITGAPAVAPNVTIQGSIVSGSTSTTKQNIGTNASGVVEQATSSGIATLSTYQAISTDIQYGAPSGGGLAQAADFGWNDSAQQMRIGETSVPGFAANVDILTASGPGGLTTHTTSTGSGDFTGFIAYLGSSLTAPPYVQFFVPVLANTGFGPSGSVIFDAATSGSGQLRFGNSVAGSGIDLYTGGVSVGRTTRMHLASAGDWQYVAMATPSAPPSGSGTTWFGSSTKNLFAMTDAGAVTHTVQTQTAAAGKAFTALTDAGVFAETSFQAPLTACTDYVSVGCQTGSTDIGGTNGTTTVIGIENDAAMRGDILATSSAAPATPSAGHGRVWFDSTAKTFTAINDAGGKTHTVRSQTALTSFFLTSLSDSGNLGIAQPAFTDVSGTLACGQSEGPWTGDVSKAANSCATILNNIPNDTTMAGDVLAANAATPSSPASGHARVFTSSFGNIASVNSSGTVNHGVQTNSCAAHQWLNAIGDPGNSACVRPDYSDLSGTPPVTSTLPYAFVFLAILNTGELISGGSSPTATGAIGITQTEYPMGFAFNNVTLKCNLVHNFITSGTFTLKAARDSVDTTASLSFTSSTTTGLTYTSGPVSISSPSAADTYGLDVTSTGTSSSCGGGLCPSDIMCTVILTP